MQAYKKKLTRRARFLAGINQAAPWNALEQRIEPFYPKRTGAGRRSIGIARMLRMYVAQQYFGLSDEGIEDAIYDSQAIRDFVGIDPIWGAAPDATTLRKALPAAKLGRMREKLEVHKASVRAKVEHPFHVIKNPFRHRKTRNRGLEKNAAQLFTLFGLTNLVLARRRFATPATRRTC